MRKSLTTLLMIAAMCFPHVAQAQPKGPRSAEGDCRAMSETYGPQTVWWGRFSGGRESYRFFNADMIEYHTAERCFMQRAACEAWLYDLKSRFNFMPRWNQCDRGYRPGAPVKRF